MRDKRLIITEVPENYIIPKDVLDGVPEMINAMAAVTGRWATEEFVDAGKTMLGWMKLGAWRAGRVSDMMKQMIKFAAQVHDEKNRSVTTDIVLIGQGGSIECIKTLYTVFGKSKDCPKVHIIDTVDQEVIAGIKSSLPFEKTRFVVLSKSMTTAEVHSLYKLFFDECLSRGMQKEKVQSRFTLITDEGKASLEKSGAVDVLKVSEKVRSPFREEVLARGFCNIFYIEPCSGGRYSWDTAVGILPAMIMGIDVASILKGAEAIESSAKSPELSSNPAAQYGIFKYAMQLEGKNRPTLILPEEIKAYGPWNGQLDTESLGKANDKSSLTIDHEELPDDPAIYTKKRFFVRIKTGANDNRFDKNVDNLKKSGLSVFTSTLLNSSKGKVDAEDFGALLKMSEFATAIAGYLMKINPVNQPGVEEYKKAQEAYLKEGVSTADPKYSIQYKNITLSYDACMGENKIHEDNIKKVLSCIGKSDAPAIYASLVYLAAKDMAKDYAVMMIFKRLSLHPLLTDSMNKWRKSVRSILHIDTLGEEAPCILHAKQQGFQQGEKSGFFTVVRFKEYGKEKIVIPGSLEKYGSQKTFEDLAKAQAAGTLSALSAAGQMGVMIELKNTEKNTLSEFSDFIENSIKYLGCIK